MVSVPKWNFQHWSTLVCWIWSMRWWSWRVHCDCHDSFNLWMFVLISLNDPTKILDIFIALVFTIHSSSSRYLLIKWFSWNQFLNTFDYSHLPSSFIDIVIINIVGTQLINLNYSDFLSILLVYYSSFVCYRRSLLSCALSIADFMFVSIRSMYLMIHDLNNESRKWFHLIFSLTTF